jgi:hypothetical protein
LIRAQAYYFDGDAVLNPFSHTWSLGVEEQFYLLFPLVAFAVRRRSTFVAMAGLGLLLICSLVLSGWWSELAPTVGYYAMPSRFWELGCGAIVALAERGGMADALRERPLLVRLCEGAATSSLAAAIALTPQRGFPFPWALAAVIPTAVLLVSGKSVHALTARVLALRAPVTLGRWSYSLYLWHWPLIVIGGMTVGTDDAMGVGAVVVATLVASIASYRFVETPLRFHPAGGRRVLMYSLAVLVLTSVGVETLRRSRYALFLGPRQDWHDWLRPADEPVVEGSSVTRAACHLNRLAALGSEWRASCSTGSAPSTAPVLYAVGDSHASANLPMVALGAERGAYKLVALSHDACALRREAGTTSDSCAVYWASIRKELRYALRPGDLVLLSAYLRGKAFFSADSRSALTELALLVRTKGATLVVQMPLPVLDELAVDCLPAWFRRPKATCRKSAAVDLAERAPAARFLENLAATSPGIVLWDPHTVLCAGGTCEPFKGSRPIFRDDDHLSDYASSMLGSAFVDFLQKQGVIR